MSKNLLFSTSLSHSHPDTAMTILNVLIICIAVTCYNNPS